MNNFLSKCSIKLRLSTRISLSIGLLLLLLWPSVASFAQKITLSYQNAPLEQVLREIRKQSGYDIFFDQNLVVQQPPVAVKITNANVEEAMSSVLKGLPLSYAINGRAISIKKSDKVIATTRQQKITITGTVVDDDGIPISGVSVSSAGVKSVYTDGLGKFTLKDIEPLAIVRITYTGKLTVERTALAVSLMGIIQMDEGSTTLNETLIQGQRMAGKPIGFKVDLANRRQQSLAQVLEGTIPGLVIKTNRVTTSQRLHYSIGPEPSPGTYTLEQMIAWFKAAYAGGFLERYAEAFAIAIFEEGLKNGSTVNNVTTNNIVIPELRGAGGFGNGNNAMLVVIDGFVQDGFPADYPMMNILSIEVIRDPAETIKWGPTAANGVIIINTKPGVPGALQINYGSTFNFSKTPDNSAKALQIANTSQLLNYYLEEDTRMGINGRPTSTNELRLSPALILLAQRYLDRNKPGAQQAFEANWNLLSQLSNEQQYRELQQRPFDQNQNLSIAGGGKQHNFSINTNYRTSRNESFGNSGRIWGLNLNDRLSLLDNKLQISLQVNGTLNRAVPGKTLDPKEMEPYQMLYRADGSYIYDYSLRGINAYNNTRLNGLYPGLEDYGYNPLQEARGTQALNKSHSLNSSLNVNWKLLEGLTFSTALQYINNRTNSQTLYTKDTQYARNLYNSYYAVNKTEMVELFPGFFVPRNTPLNPPVAYLPYGDIYETSKNSNNTTNLRTGFSYNRLFSNKHALSMRVGFSYYDQMARSNRNMPLYGYNSSTGTGTTFSLADPAPVVSGVLGNQLIFNPLTQLPPATRTPDRNMSASAAADYTYDGRLGLQAFYNESFMPINSIDIYSSTRNYNAMASWSLHKESFFKFPLISKLKLSAGLGEIKMASLPVNLPATRVFDRDLNVYYLEVTGYNPVRQNGEQIRNYDALLDLGLFKDILQGQLNYRYNSMGVKNQLSGRLSYHISKAGYFNVPWISNLMVEGLVSNISPAQAIAQMMSTNSPLAAGGFTTATGNFNLGSLPAHIQNTEISLRLGLLKDRLTLDTRYYNRSNKGLSNGTFQSDLSTGFSERPVYSQMNNKGYELYLQGKIFEGDGFNWTTTINAAYNINQVKNVPTPRFENTTGYLSANRNGYASGSLWSYRWAGLNDQGDPQVYDPNGNKVVAVVVANTILNPLNSANDSWLEYSGRTKAPWSGGFIQEFGYKGIYARATLRFALGHVMRTYRPGTLLQSWDKSSLIDQRWRQPGDEAKTDIPGISSKFTDYLRTFAAQNSSNSIAPADYVRLSDVQFGYDFPAAWLKGKHVKRVNLALNLQDVALWTRNKLGIDPEAIGPDGRLFVRRPMRYGLSLMVGL